MQPDDNQRRSYYHCNAPTVPGQQCHHCQRPGCCHQLRARTINGQPTLVCSPCAVLRWRFGLDPDIEPYSPPDLRSI
jgi:hypothetical protein